MMNRVLEEHLQPYLAHVRRNEDGSFEIHHLEEHLRAAADLRRAMFLRFYGRDFDELTRERVLAALK